MANNERGCGDIECKAKSWSRYFSQHRKRSTGALRPSRRSLASLAAAVLVSGLLVFLSASVSVQPPFANRPVARRFVVISGGTRVRALYRLLHSLCLVIDEGDRLDLDVWFDIPEGADPIAAADALKPMVDDITRLGRNGTYTHGIIRARAWDRHMGLRGQWLEAWHASIPGGLNEDTQEVGLILEDDLELSPYSWRWLKAAFAAYGHDERVAGFTLQRAGLCAAQCPNIEVGGPDGAGGAFFYPLVGTWGYAPTAKSFSRFRRWMQSRPDTFKPYVEGLTPTLWYKNFEKKGTEKQVGDRWCCPMQTGILTHSLLCHLHFRLGAGLCCCRFVLSLTSSRAPPPSLPLQKSQPTANVDYAPH
jgi:hypothetical protein